MLKAATVVKIKHQDIPVLNKYSRAEATTKIEEMVKSAGYEQCTPIQKNIIPLIFQGRDFFIETFGAQGKSLAALISALLRVDYAKPHTQALIISVDPKEVSKIQRQFLRFPEQVRKNLRIAPIGFEKNPKKELRYFNSFPHLIIGTTERIIDHLRRNNVNVGGVELLIILDTSVDENESFLQDILFITSKTVELQQKLVFSSISRSTSALLENLHRPHILEFSDWNDVTIDHAAYFVNDVKEKLNVIKSLYYADKEGKTVLLTKNISQASTLEKRLSAEGIPVSMYNAKQGKGKKPPEEDFFITTFKTFDSNRTIDFDTIVFYQFPAQQSLYAQALKKVMNSSEKKEFISLLLEKERKNFDMFKEEYKVDIKEENLPEEKEIMLKGFIEKTIKTIKEEENPEVLDRYKKIVKRHVPFFLRSYFTAYLLKQLAHGKNSEPFTTLFVSVGKNRKVFPKDLSKLFASAVKIDPSTIGNIKILDSYSFIDIPAHKAQDAIDSLNNKDYRGRSLTVNYARKKEDKKN